MIPRAIRVALLSAIGVSTGGCSLFGFFEDAPCRDEAECSEGGDGDADQPPADVRGVYELDIRNRDNGCDLEDWTVGALTENVQLTLTQDGREAVGVVGGLIGPYLRITVGSDTLTGTVTGNDIELSLMSTTDVRDPGRQCRYRSEGTVRGTLTGNGLEGTIEYGYFIIREFPDCDDLGSCVSVQTFAGSRPPPD